MTSPCKELVGKRVQGARCLGCGLFQKIPRTSLFEAIQTKTSIMAVLALSVFCGMSSTAIAGPSCTDAPKEQWIQADVMRTKIVAENYKVDVFKVTKGRCYEIYGRDKSGARVEVYFNPVTGEVVKTSVLR